MNRRNKGRTKCSKRKYCKYRRQIKQQTTEYSIVNNISKHKLTLAEERVLNKGFTFCVTNNKINEKTLQSDMKRFERKLQLYYHFNKDNPENEPDTDNVDNPIFEKNSDWWPKKLQPEITQFCNEIQNKILVLSKQKCRNNLTKREFKALIDLKRNNEIIIKKGDKSSGVIILDKNEYRTKITDMLNDPAIYTKTNVNDTESVKKEADNLIMHLHAHEKLTTKQARYLKNFEPKCPVFYGIPKTHKAGNPLRPIVSQINGPTASISKYVSEQLAIAEKQIPYILQDTTAFLQIIDKMTVNNNTKLVVMDVCSLYTNIPHEEGAEWVSEFYEETLDKWPTNSSQLKPISRELLKELILFILNNCTFEFNNEFYRQNFGTTMGASFSVRFANVYMHKFFQNFFNKYNGEKPAFIARLIDDVFFTWDADLESLNSLINSLNSDHATIKFEPTISDKEVNFLDTIVYKLPNDSKLGTKIYRKPTYKPQYLHFKSNHPSHVKRAIPYSQALRYRRIIDNDEILNTELNKLTEFFLQRSYPKQLLESEIDKVRNVTRNDTLKYKTAQEKRENFIKFTKNGAFLPLIIIYDDRYKHTLSEIINENWQTMLNKNKKLSDVFQQSRPQIVYKKGQTISSILVRAKFLTHNSYTLHAAENTTDVNNIDKCLTRLCQCCKAINVNSNFMSTSTKQCHRIKTSMNCNTSGIIYLITCKHCKLQYVGETERRLKDRLNAHRSNITTKQKTAIAIHFNNYRHSYKDLQIMPIEKVLNNSKQARQEREKFWIKTLKTNYPNGLNYYPINYSTKIEHAQTQHRSTNCN